VESELVMGCVVAGDGLTYGGNRTDWREGRIASSVEKTVCNEKEKLVYLYHKCVQVHHCGNESY